METFSESAACLICFEIIENPIFVGPDAAAKILKNCKIHLHSTITKETLKDVHLKNENEIPLCKSCFESAWEITKLNVQLETVQKEISASTETVHQDVQQFNKKINHNIIIDHQPDDNIEITHVKFESCDLQLEDSPERCQQTTASVDAEISFSNECQDYNQPGLENAETSLGFQREVRTTEEIESADSINLKGDMGVISEMMKQLKTPQVELKRMQIVDLKAEARSTSSCQQKSQPRPQLLNKYKDNGSSNSNCASAASSNSMGGKRLKCRYCEKTFDDDWKRNRHHRSHTGEKPYKCSFCTKRFCQISDQKRHERVHTGEKPYKCSFCTKEFALAKSTRVHERVHTGEKPYECSICSKGFADKGHLKRHERIHTGEKPHECSFCKKRFIQIGQLKSHERTHTGEKLEKRSECSFCQKQFITCYEKKCHERVHTGEKPYKCSVCTKEFARAKGLRIHERIHTGEKPYKCSICSKGFADISNLTRHERTHTSEKP